jgi:hypothetical protein
MIAEMACEDSLNEVAFFYVVENPVKITHTSVLGTRTYCTSKVSVIMWHKSQVQVL